MTLEERATKHSGSICFLFRFLSVPSLSVSLGRSRSLQQFLLVQVPVLSEILPELCSMKIQLAACYPQSLSKDPQNNNHTKSEDANRSLDPETLLRAHSIGPSHLKIADNKTARGPSKVDPSSYFTRPLRIRIEIVGIQSDGRDHDAKDVESPCHRGNHIMVSIFEAEPQ